jgi:hypothetical protein
MTNATLHAAPPLTAVKSDWDVVCETGRLAASQLDEGRWILGDLALLVDKQYGEDKMGDFAKECQVPKKRIYEYRQVCGYWGSSVRADLWELPTVTYSLMRLAMRLENVDEARRFVERTASKGYTVDKAHYVMGRLLGLAGKRKRRPKKLADFVATYEHSANQVAAAIYNVNQDLKAKYRIVIYKA